VAKALDPTRAAIKQLVATKPLRAEGDAIIVGDAADAARYNALDDVIAPKETIDATIVLQMAIMDSPSGGYRSTAALEAVKTYLDKTYTVDSGRPPGKFGVLIGGTR
jgi:hypothetical protein